MAPDPSVEFECEVAFSLLHEDRSTANAIKEAIAPTVRGDVFLYTDDNLKAKIAAREGHEVFRSAFRHNSRVVVVLYRPPWGETKWTAIEQEAIRDRKLSMAGDLSWLVIVSLDRQQPRPSWYPETGTRVNFYDDGVRGASAVIKNVVGRHGGEVRPETPLELAERQVAEEEAEAARSSREASEGPREVKKHLTRLFDGLEEETKRISAAGLQMNFTPEKRATGCVIHSSRGLKTLQVNWKPGFAKSARDSVLDVRLTKSDPLDKRVRMRKEIARLHFSFRLDEEGRWVWRKVAGPGSSAAVVLNPWMLARAPSRSTDQLRDYLLRRLLQ